VAVTGGGGVPHRRQDPRRLGALRTKFTRSGKRSDLGTREPLSTYPETAISRCPKIFGTTYHSTDVNRMNRRKLQFSDYTAPTPKWLMSDYREVTHKLDFYVL